MLAITQYFIENSCLSGFGKRWDVASIVKEVFTLKSPAFIEGGAIPFIYTCDNEDKRGISPPLKWKNVPKDTKSFTLIMDDPDVPHDPGTSSRVWDHWVLFNIPAVTTTLEQALKNLPEGVKLGLNGWKRLDYGGPCPPDREHRYFFKIYALDIELSLAKGASKQEIEKAMQGHILAKAHLMGRYNRLNR